MYLRVDHVNGYIDEKEVNKYLVFDSTELHSTDESKELLKNTMMFLKVKSNNYVAMNVIMKKITSHYMTIIIRSVFEEYGKLYPQVFLDDTLYELST